MNRKILGLLASLALAAGCEFAKKTTYEGPIDQCRSAGGACTENAECCSYGCTAGVCVPGDHVGTVCRTTDDCGYPDLVSFTQMTCKSGSCAGTTATTCRDDADVCTSSTQCCGHHCSAAVGGRCVPNKIPVITVNGAVQTVPRNQPWAMNQSASASDPDTGETATLVYGWTITPVNPPGATGWSFPVTTGPSPTFTPGSTLATYLVSLTVTDTWGATATASFNLDVVNTPPVVTPEAATASNARNVGPFSVPMSVYDENGDTLTCTWAICRAGTATCLPAPAAPATFSALKSAPKPLSALFPTGLTGVDEGPWDVTLGCTDGLVSSVGTTTVTVTNTPPAIVVPATRTFNLGVDAASTPDAIIAASATDANADAIASWTWTVASAPPGSLVDTADLGLTASQSTATFKPDVASFTIPYALDVTACDEAAYNPPYVDRPGDCRTVRVLATVYPYIRPLDPLYSGAAIDAAFARGTSLARLVLVAADGAAGALWDYDLLAAAGTPPVKTALDRAPNAVALTPDGGTAVVGDDLNAYKVVLGAPATKTTWTSPVSIGDVVAVSANDAYVFPKTQGAGVYFQHLDLNNPSSSTAFTSTARYGAWGASVAPVANGTYYVADTYNRYLVRLKRQGNGELFEAWDTTYAGGQVWSTFNASPAGHVVSSDGTVYGVTPTQATTTVTETGVTLGTSGIRSVDASPTESVVLALTTGAGSVRRYNSGFNLVTTDALPHWGNGGINRDVEGLFAFVSNDGATAYVVLKTTSPPVEYGLYTYALP
ncbi:MAG TPA: hypothetical protein VLT61_00955 [Anaeromyxobacteraceae bacterium]|nr:hypothetical protein [Anaeromyxobacteraceae bacterium]